MDLAQLLGRQRSGFALERPFYSDPEIFAREFEAVFSREWLFVEHESRVPGPGDYLLYEIAGESLIVIRDSKGFINAFFNVCRHRGSRICTSPHLQLSRLELRARRQAEKVASHARRLFAGTL